MFRKARLAILGAAAAMLLALLAMHAPPGRALVLRRVVDALRTSYGIDLRAGSLSYNLLTLSAELRGVQVSAVRTPAEPFAAADAVTVSFGARTLIGEVSVTRLSIASPRLDIRRRADGTDNLPRVSSGPSKGAGFVLPPIRVDDLEVSFRQPSSSAVVRGAALQLTSGEQGRISASVTAQRGMAVTVGERTIDLDSAGATGDLDGDRLDLRDVRVSGAGGVLEANGRIVFRGGASTIDATVSASSRLESWWVKASDTAAPPVGRVDVTARLTGSLSDPLITFEANSGSLAWPDVQVTGVRARGGYRSGELSLNSVALGFEGGTVDAHGTVVVDAGQRPSRIEARWANVDTRRIPALGDIQATVARNGTAVVEWRADGIPASRRFDVVATTGVVASGSTIPLTLHGSGRAGRWHVEASNRDESAVRVSARADVGLDAQRWQASTIAGRVLLRSANLPVAIRQARDLGVPTGFDAATAGGAIDVDANLDGTLGAVRSTGRIRGDDVTVAGSPQFDLDASFAVDVARKTSTGTFGLLAPALESATFPRGGDLTLGGSLAAAGTWSGPFRDPAVDVSVTGRDLMVGRASLAITATGGKLDGVLKGPVTTLGGGGTLTIGSVDIGGRGAGAVTADLTVFPDSVRVEARAPAVNTSLDISIGLSTPNPFDGRATVADYDVGDLLRLAGARIADPRAVRGRISSSVALKGELRNLRAASVTLDVAPIDATAFDVPIVMSRGLRASLTGRDLRLEPATATIGGLTARVGGAIATDTPGGTLVLDVDGDLGPLSPWLSRLSRGGATTAAGRVTGHLEAAAASDGLVTTGTLDTTLTTISKGDRLLAKDLRAAVVLTGGRAELRQATGTVRGGRLSATGDAPLIWLNRWLPSGFQLAPAVLDRPAALEGTASFDVPALFALFGRTAMETVGGSIELSAKLTASRPEAAAIAGDLALQRGVVTAADLSYAQSDVTRFRLDAGALTIERFDWRGPGSKVVATGTVGLGLVEGVRTNVRLDVDTDLGIVGALLSSRATGRLTGTIDVRGRSGALQVTSDAALSDASWLIPGQRILFAGWSGQMRLADQALSVTKLGGTVNGGTLRIDGRLLSEDDGAAGGLTIAARDILIEVPRGLHSQLGADLVWRRTDRAAQLTGTVEITANRYTEPVTRVLQLVNSLSSATRGSGQSLLPPWLAGTTLDIGLAVTDPIVIDNSVGTVELMPDLRLAGTIASPALSGRVDAVDDGRITIGGRAYRLRDSRVRFAPADGLVPTLDAAGDTRIGDYDVTIRISGTPDRIETAFSSVPPLGERELQSLIVTGRTGEQATPGRQSDENFAAAAATGDILGFAGRFVGLDTVRLGAPDLDLVSKDVSTAQHLTVSKSLGSAFELIFSDNLEEGSLTWVLVWKPTPVNEIRASSVEDGTRAIEFRRLIAFGKGSPVTTRTRRRRAAEQGRAIVDVVRITGSPGFSDEEISRELELDAGNRFDVRRWIEDRHRLENFYLDHGYHRVRITPTRSEAADRSRVSLTYDIRRGPRTVIEISGDPLPDKVVDEMYEAWRGLPIADVVRTEFERIARAGLGRRGYYRPVLRLDFSQETADLARVTVDVARGPRTKELLVAWTGNRDVSNAELDAVLAPHQAESDVWLDSEALAWQVRQLYESRGHLKAQVTVGELVFHDTDATLPVVIDEGVLSRLAAVRFEGVDAARTKDATAALGLAVGERFASSAPAEATRRLKAFYAGLGYRSATVAHTLTTASDGAVSIAWTVTEGPLYRVKDVNVVGAETTNGGLVRKAIALQPGDPAGQEAIDTTRRNLYDLGAFRRVDFDFGDSALQPGAHDELPVTLTIQAEEPQRFQFKYGVQFSFDRSTGNGGGNALGASVELRDRNFIGRVVQASLGAHWDPDLQIVGLLFSAPRLFGERVRTNVYARERREQDVRDSTPELEGGTLDDRRRDLTFEQRWRPAPAWELVWGYNVSSRRFLLDQDDQHVDTGGLLAGPVVSVVVDRRDSPFDATKGLFHSSSLQFGVPSLGSDLGYLRYLVRQSYYQPLGKLTAAGSVRYGTIHDYSGRAPASIVDLLFNAGGTNSVRGYPEDSLSAINIGGFALGGTDLLVVNGELRYPITKRLGGAAFVDAGNTFASIADIRFGRLAWGAGLGLRIRTPLAPFRVDVAYPLSNTYGRHTVRVHFSIAQMF